MSSPWPTGRGPIEAVPGRQVSVLSCQSSPWPTGRGPIEALLTFIDDEEGEVSSLHGLLAVAPLKQETDDYHTFRSNILSMAYWPWPH